MSKPPAKLRLKIANGFEDILERAKITTISKDFKFHFVRSDQSNESWQQILMALIEINMRTMYEKSNWGWKYEEKLSEIIKSSTRLIIVTEANNSLGMNNISNALPNEEEANRFVGFMSYRFEIGADKNECALYVYEIHVTQEYQGKGLGKELMRIAKTLAISFKMDKIMLTVFNFNKQALEFYKKLQFSKDKSSPSQLEVDYVILSHKIK